MSCNCFPCLLRVVAPTLNSTILDCRLDLRIHHWRRHIVFSLLISIRTSYNQVVHCWAGEIPTLQRAERLMMTLSFPPSTHCSTSLCSVWRSCHPHVQRSATQNLEKFYACEFLLKLCAFDSWCDQHLWFSGACGHRTQEVVSSEHGLHLLFPLCCVRLSFLGEIKCSAGASCI